VDVVLARRQLEQLQRAVGGTAVFQPWLARAVVETPTLTRVTMPAIGWETVIAVMADRVFNRRGQRNGSVPRSASRALMHISARMINHRCHPALANQRLAGWHPDLIPVWHDRDHFELFPCDGAFQILVPRFDTVNGLDYTEWNPGRVPRDDPLFHEDEHWAFITG
jgi:hypothetical protein